MKLFGLVGEDVGKRVRHRDRKPAKKNPGDCHKHHAFPQNIGQFFFVLRPIIEGDDRRDPNRITDEDGKEDEADIPDHPICHDPGLSNIFEKLNVIDDRDDGGRYIAHEFAAAVEDALPNLAEAEPCFPQMDEVVLPEHKIKERTERANQHPA